ncbi:SLATT domain-containing protein, partial [Streptomyces calidiresistens]
VGPWGYPLLLGAVACLACDRWFGLTSGWMRDVATAQAVQRRLEALRYEWATESVREALGPTEGTAGEAAERCLGVLRRFSEDVTELVRAETADWMLEFRGGGAALLTQTAAVTGAAGREEGPTRVGAGRFPSPPPGARPTMPRQRPPEGPRL